MGFIGSIHATHIAGGTLQLNHITGNQYKLTLTAFYGAEKSVTQSEYTSKSIYAYEYGSSKFIRIFTVKFESEEIIKSDSLFFYPCDPNIFPVSKFTYTADIILHDSIFKSPLGTVFLAENYNRHEEIKNITDPSSTGITYYLKFPRVQSTISNFNSSPIFKESFSKKLYVRKNSLAIFDFSATDSDNDILQYSLATPYDRFYSNSPVFLNYQNGYNLDNLVQGNPTLSISSATGFANVYPTETGIFVFTVVCKEYRNGVEIGVTRKDLEIFVYDETQLFSPPVFSYKYLGKLVKNNISIEVNAKKCFQVGISNTIKGEEYYLESTTSGLNFYLETNLFTVSEDTTWLDVCIDNCSIFDLKAGNFQLSAFNPNVCYSEALNSSAVAVDLIPYKGEVIDILTDFNYLPVNEGDSISFNVWSKISTVLSFPSKLTYSYSTFDNSLLSNLQVSEILINKHLFQDSVFLKTSCYDSRKSPAIFKFKATVFLCGKKYEDTLTIPVYIKEVPYDLTASSLPNIFTPNNDGQNDVFSMPNLPKDVCDNYFKSIEIYNRWGVQVYKKTQKDFQWSGTLVPDGLYYYTLDLNIKKFKGIVELVR